MKKIFFAALAAVALTACVADVVTEEPTYAIDFVSNTKGGVKSLVKDAETFTAFRVFAFNNETETIKNTIMNDMLVTKDGNNWTYSPKKYWPAKGNVDFYGVSIDPTAESEYVYNYGANAADGLTFDITMAAATGVVDAANLPAGVTGVVDAANIPDAVYAAAMGKTKDNTNSPVLMTFRHAMAQVDFKISNNTTPADQVTVTSGDVYVDGLKCDGKYTVKNISTTAGVDSPIGTWALGNNNISYLFGKKVTTIAAGVKSESILNEDCLVFPQEAESAVAFRVWCTIKQKGVVIFEGYKTAQVQVDWMQGHKYTYTFVLEDAYLTNNLIKISAAVVDYKDTEGQPNKKDI